MYMRRMCVRCMCVSVHLCAYAMLLLMLLRGRDSLRVWQVMQDLKVSLSMTWIELNGWGAQ
jgi:hypothetical protein